MVEKEVDINDIIEVKVVHSVVYDEVKRMLSKLLPQDKSRIESAIKAKPVLADLILPGEYKFFFESPGGGRYKASPSQIQAAIPQTVYNSFAGRMPGFRKWLGPGKYANATEFKTHLQGVEDAAHEAELGKRLHEFQALPKEEQLLYSMAALVVLHHDGFESLMQNLDTDRDNASEHITRLILHKIDELPRQESIIQSPIHR
jgi:hypothetical protein